MTNLDLDKIRERDAACDEAWMDFFGRSGEEGKVIRELAEERHALLEHIERMAGCLRNCRNNLYHPHMPNLITALEAEIDAVTGGALTMEKAQATICKGCGRTLYACECASVGEQDEPPEDATDWLPLLQTLKARMECHFQPCASYSTSDDDTTERFDSAECDCILNTVPAVNQQAERRSDRAEDRAYYNGARQAAAMAHQSLDAMDDWIESGCGGRGPVANPCADGCSYELRLTGPDAGFGKCVKCGLTNAEKNAQLQSALNRP